MGAGKKLWQKKPLGFSLLELMVVVAILGVLATVAVPRFNIFRARSRQAEAKSSLGVIFTLQESFAIDHEQYFNGNATTWGGTQMDSNSTEYGYGGSGDDGCVTGRSLNKLGFRLSNCAKARYGYWMLGANETGFTAIAHAPSDVVGDKRVFPGCKGDKGASLARNIANGTTNVPAACNTGNNGSPTVADSAYSQGDAWCIDGDRDLHNYRDITEFCEN